MDSERKTLNGPATPKDGLLCELKQLRGILDEVGAYVYTKDCEGRYTYVNRLVQQLFGASGREILGRTDEEFFDLVQSNHINENDLKVMREGICVEREEIDFLKGTGERRVYWSVKKPLRDLANVVVGMCGISTDITELHRLKEMLLELSSIDELTGVSNRRHFMQESEKELHRARRQKSPTALAMIDIDLFKAVNDNFGHPVGDDVIRNVATVIRRNVRDHDLVSRVGGEEFSVFMPQTNLASACALAERLRRAVEIAPASAMLPGNLFVSVSIGVAAVGQPCDGLAQLYSRADAMLYRAKEQGRNRVCCAEE